MEQRHQQKATAVSYSGMRTCIGLLAVAALLVGSCGCSAVRPLLAPKEGLSSWMGALPQSVRDGPFQNLVLPGSHDSATYTLAFNETPPMQGSVYQVLLDLALDPLTGPIVSAPIHDLTITHRTAIAPGQLEAGIRALDLRVLYNNRTQHATDDALGDPFYFSHSFAAVPMNATLLGVAQFLATHPSEVLVVQLSPDWEHRTQTNPKIGYVLSVVSELLGEWLVPFDAALSDTFFANTSLSQLVAANRRVLFSFDDPLDLTPYPLIWPQTMVNAFWPNGQTVNESMARIDAYLADGLPATNDGQLNLIFFTITPSDDSIVENVIEHLGNLTNVTSLHDYAREIRPDTLTTLAKAVGEERKKVNIVSVDWPNEELVSLVVALNRPPL